jgi:hypothetical protein
MYNGWTTALLLKDSPRRMALSRPPLIRTAREFASVEPEIAWRAIGAA